MSNTNIEKLPPVRQMMIDANLIPKKALGQNFLFDLNLTNKIANTVPNIKNTTILEIGPGPGGLTRSLLMAGAGKLIVIEKDNGTESILMDIANAASDRMEIIFDDALKIFKNSRPDFFAGDISICANLPYNIGTELLIRWLHCIADKECTMKIKSMTLMFQREVALRVVAPARDEHYGRLGVLTALLADSKILFNVPNTAFTPAPNVMSAIVQIIPNDKKIAKISDLSKIEKLTAKLFGQRRKMIRGIIPNINWSDFGLTGTERAEELSPEKFAEMAEFIPIV